MCCIRLSHPFCLLQFGMIFPQSSLDRHGLDIWAIFLIPSHSQTLVGENHCRYINIFLVLLHFILALLITRDEHWTRGPETCSLSALVIPLPCCPHELHLLLMRSQGLLCTIGERKCPQYSSSCPLLRSCWGYASLHSTVATSLQYKEKILSFSNSFHLTDINCLVFIFHITYEIHWFIIVSMWVVLMFSTYDHCIPHLYLLFPPFSPLMLFLYSFKMLYYQDNRWV